MRLKHYLWSCELFQNLPVLDGNAFMENLFMVHKVSRGLYAWTPLGLKSLKKVSAIVREEQEKIGGLECMMTMVQPYALWEASGRSETFSPELSTFQDRYGEKLLCGPTGEEIMIDFFKHYIKNTDHLPKMFFQLQWKFQNREVGSRNLIESREFITKDGYSFDKDASSARAHYISVLGAYAKAFKNIGVRVIVVPITGEDFCHELVILTQNLGEEYAYEDAALLNADDPCACLDACAGLSEVMGREGLHKSRGVSVGGLKDLGTKYTQALGAYVQESQGGSKQPVFMGAYRVNLSVLLVAVMDAFLDQKGMVWQTSFAPFVWSLLADDSPVARRRCDALYAQCQQKSIDLLYDDRSLPYNQRHLEMSVLGLPYQVLVSEEEISLTKRSDGTGIVVSEDALIQKTLSNDLAGLFIS